MPAKGISNKTIVTTGGAGFVGRALSTRLRHLGATVVSIDRIESPVSGVISIVHDLTQPIPRHRHLHQPDAWIHLAGETIAGRWNPAKKKRIYDSRIIGTRNIGELFHDVKFRPETFLCANAVGYYGDAGTVLCSEDHQPGDTFLAGVAKDWQAAAEAVGAIGIRTVIMRHGHILGRGGLLAALVPKYRRGLGGPWADGQQFFPWIHIDDVVSAYIHALGDQRWSGPVNLVAPEITTQKTFSATLAAVMCRPHWLRLPAWLLRILLGEFATEMLVSQKVQPAALHRLQFAHSFPALYSALCDILQHWEK